MTANLKANNYNVMHQSRVIKSAGKGHVRQLTNAFDVEFDWLRVQRLRSDWLKRDGWLL